MALVKAANSGLLGDVRRLLASAPERVNERAPASGDTALLVASYAGDAPLVDLILAAPGVDVDAANRFGVTPLNAAADQGCDRVVARLLAAGADADAASGGGTTPLQAACHGGHDAAVEALVRAGARLEVFGAEAALAVVPEAARAPPRPRVALPDCGVLRAHAVIERNNQPARIAERHGHHALAEYLTKVQAAGGFRAHLAESRRQLALTRALFARGAAAAPSDDGASSDDGARFLFERALPAGAQARVIAFWWGAGMPRRVPG